MQKFNQCDVSHEYKSLCTHINAGNVPRLTDHVEQLADTPELLKATLLFSGEGHISHYLVHLAIEKAADGAAPELVTVLLQAGRELGILHELMHQEHWNCYWGDTLATAVWLDSCKETHRATQGIFEALRDDRSLVRRYFVETLGERPHSDSFLHMANREYGVDVLQYGVEMLRRSGLLEEAYEKKNDNGSLPFHIAAFRGSQEQARIMVDAAADTPALLKRCLMAANGSGMTPLELGGEVARHEPNLAPYLQQTQAFLRLKLAEAKARLSALGQDGPAYHPDGTKTVRLV